jgi:hypothetical protein
VRGLNIGEPRQLGPGKQWIGRCGDRLAGH